MNNSYLKNNKAMVCANKDCVTVYGNTAKVVNAIVITTVVIAAIALLVKVLR